MTENNAASLHDITDPARVRELLAEAEARAETLRAVLAVLEGRPAAAPGPAVRLLTRRQREVLELIGNGEPNAQIATALRMSENTVRIHVSAVLKTLGLRNRTEAALWWREHGSAA